MKTYKLLRADGVEISEKLQAFKGAKNTTNVDSTFTRISVKSSACAEEKITLLVT